MKAFIYQVFFFVFLVSGSLHSQDVSLTNAILEAPAGAGEWGQACFTIVSETGLDVAGQPLKIQVSMSQVEFDAMDVSGFNSEKFAWSVDPFSTNVVVGVHVQSVGDVNSGEGGAQVCIPAKTGSISTGNDSYRDGFVVNILPGSVDQGMNLADDHIVRFGWSPVSSGFTSNFEAEKKDEKVLLSWSNNSYIESEFYEIERSFDGINFDVINTMASNESPLFATVYEFEDVTFYDDNQSDLDGKVYYRINNVNTRGKSNPSEVKNVKFDLADHSVLVYPNPAKDFVTIASSLEGENNKMNVYNSNGQALKRGVMIKNNMKVSISDWNPGIYYMEFRDGSNNVITTQNIVVIR